MVSAPPDGNQRVVFGTLTRPHGIKGELRLQPARRGDVLPQAVEALWVQSKHGSLRRLAVRSVRRSHDVYLVALEDVPDRTAAEALAGSTALIDAALLPALQDGEMYLYELLGVALVDASGQGLGTVRATIDNHGQDLLVVDTPRGERLLPAVPAFLRKLDRSARQLTVVVPEGLWDDEAPPKVRNS